MTGQDAVKSADEFNKRLGITGIILTKMDGDARGGAALSIRAVTGQPLKFVGVGEKSDALEPFHPDRVAQRILGMGDVLSLIEKVEESIDQKQAEEMQRKLLDDDFTLADFRDQMKQLRKLGPLESLLGMMPQIGPMKDLKNVKVDEKEITRLVAIIDSMTPKERANHMIINGARRRQDRQGQRHVGAGSEYPAEAVCAGAQDDEEFYGRRRVPGQAAREIEVTARHGIWATIGHEIRSVKIDVDDSFGAVRREEEAELPRGGDRKGTRARQPVGGSGGHL